MANSPYQLKKYREPAGPIATFRQLLTSGTSWAWLNCNGMNCTHRVALPFAPYAVRWGLDVAASTYIRRHFRCSRCGEMTSTLSTPSHVVATGTMQAFPADRGLKVLPESAWILNMCNLYSLNSTREGVGQLFKVSDNRITAFGAQLTLFPGHMAPVIRMASDGERELVNMGWGFVLPQAGKAPRRVTNVRDDKIQNSDFWQSSFEESRCLVPATSFAEPDGGKPAKWFWFAISGDEPRPLFAFAGIWRRFKGMLKKDSEIVETEVFSFATTTPNSLVAAVNHDRMPVLLSSEVEFETWLSGPTHLAFKLLKKYPSELMRIVQSGADKKDLME
jgi:putative SOS response-associated peptidase YedK